LRARLLMNKRRRVAPANVLDAASGGRRRGAGEVHQRLPVRKLACAVG